MWCERQLQWHGGKLHVHLQWRLRRGRDYLYRYVWRQLDSTFIKDTREQKIQWNMDNSKSKRPNSFVWIIETLNNSGLKCIHIFKSGLQNDFELLRILNYWSLNYRGSTVVLKKPGHRWTPALYHYLWPRLHGLFQHARRTSPLLIYYVKNKSCLNGFYKTINDYWPWRSMEFPCHKMAIEISQQGIVKRPSLV